MKRLTLKIIYWVCVAAFVVLYAFTSVHWAPNAPMWTFAAVGIPMGLLACALFVKIFH